MQYLAKVNGVKTKNNRTQMIITVSDDITEKVIRLDKEGKLSIGLELNDGREITPEQRKKIYATLKDIADYFGYSPDEMKEVMKYEYISRTGAEYFSLSTCSVTAAREFINFLIDFIFEMDIPIPGHLIDRVEDITQYLYNCLKYRKCAISGKGGAHIHHVTGSRVGMGGNRQKMNHADKELIALNWYWHQQVHSQGEAEIFEKFKVYGITVDVPTLRKLGIRAEEIE